MKGVVVFTTIFGESDSLKPAPAGAAACVCFTDRPRAHADAKGWTIVYRQASNPRREAWHLRCVPEQLFASYSRSVWIDASFTLTDLPRLLKHAGDAPVAALRHHERRTCYEEARRLVRNGQARKVDAEAQMAAYQSAGFQPDHLSIACIVVRDRSEQARAFGETWDREIARWPGDNTQVSLDYSAWVHGFSIAALKGTRHQNPYGVHDHHDHKRRRRPYELPGVTA